MRSVLQVPPYSTTSIIMHYLWPFVGCISFTLAKTVQYDFNIGWVTAAPDGYSRPVIGINGQWPIPIIEADAGDTIVVNVRQVLGTK